MERRGISPVIDAGRRHWAPARRPGAKWRYSMEPLRVLKHGIIPRLQNNVAVRRPILEWLATIPPC
jgi:hypothetical protein